MEKHIVMAEVKLKMLIKQKKKKKNKKILFQFQLYHRVAYFHFDSTFPIYGPLLKKLHSDYLNIEY